MKQLETRKSTITLFLPAHGTAGDLPSSPFRFHELITFITSQEPGGLDRAFLSIFNKDLCNERFYKRGIFMSWTSCSGVSKCSQKLTNIPRLLMKTISSRRLPTAEFKEAAENSHVWGQQMRTKRLERLKLITLGIVFAQWPEVS